jgi:hypothetical protein
MTVDGGPFIGRMRVAAEWRRVAFELADQFDELAVDADRPRRHAKRSACRAARGTERGRFM